MSLKARSRNQPKRLVAAWVLCCAYSLSRVQLFVTPWTIAHQAPLSMGILQARVLEWVAMPSSRGSSQSKNQTRVSCFASGLCNSWATREAPSCMDTEVYVKGSLHIKNTWDLKSFSAPSHPLHPRMDSPLYRAQLSSSWHEVQDPACLGGCPSPGGIRGVHSSTPGSVSRSRDFPPFKII